MFHWKMTNNYYHSLMRRMEGTVAIMCSFRCFFLLLFSIWIQLMILVMFYQSEDTEPVTGHFRPLEYKNYQAECEEESKTEVCQYITDHFANKTWHDENIFQDEELLDLRNVLLVVQFGEPYYGVASKLFALYRRLFADIVFCGPDGDNFWPLAPETQAKTPLVALPNGTRFVHYGMPTKHFGENAYVCLDLALENDARAETYDGVLVIADDVLLNYWTWKPANLYLSKNWQMDVELALFIFDIDTTWFCNPVPEQEGIFCGEQFNWPWFWSNKEWYQPELKAFYDELVLLAQGSSYWLEILRVLMSITGGERRLIRGYADLFYVTQKYLPKIRPLLRLLSKHRVWLEIGALTAIEAVTPLEDLQLLSIDSHDFGWGQLRQHFLADIYRTDWQYIHPFKMSQIFKSLTSHSELNEANLPMHSINRFKFRQDDVSVNCIYCYALRMSKNYAKAIEETFGSDMY